MEIVTKKGKEVQICSRCIYDADVSGITFDEEGVCNYCRLFEQYQEQFKTGTKEGKERLENIIDKIKKEGKRKKYDCVVGVSGGTDSSYLVYKLLEWGLRPLAVHYDNTWNSAIATENIKKVLGKLNVDLYTYVVDNKEVDDIFLSFLKAGVPELDASTDLALMEVIYRAASEYKIKYVFEGHSYINEGISPISNMYFDGKYIQSIHKMFGKVPMKTYPLMTFGRFMKWTCIKRIKRIRPFWYISYDKESARTFLMDEFDWKYYGGHHLENRIVALHHSWYNYKKFNLDNRNLSLAAGARSNLIDRNSAIEEYYQTEPYMEEGLLEYFKERLKLSDSDITEILESPPKRYTDYPTYKKRFQSLKWLFWIMVKSEIVPMSFYTKYCKK